MNYSRYKISLSALIVILPLISFASGSSYSRYGIGDILRYGDSRIYALGGTGIALVGDGFINRINPAGMTRIAFTRFSTGFGYDIFSSKDENSSSKYTTTRLQELAIAVPISRENGITFSFEYTPYSTVNYAISSSVFDAQSGSYTNQTYYGSGGLSYFGLGLSMSPMTTLHLGTRINYMYGRTQQYQKITFLTPTTYDRSTYYSGFTFTFGTIYEGIDELLKIRSLKNLTIGFTLTTAASLDADEHRTYPGSSYFIGDSTYTRAGYADLPFSVGFGLSYLLQDRYRFLGDVVFEDWENSKYFGFYYPGIRNSFRTSFGFEAMPSRDVNTYWNRIIYRLGFAYNSSYYQVNSTGINEYLMSGGLSLPIGPESRINIGLQVGLRGTTDNKLQKDTIVRLSIAISASEIWFLKFDEE